ncbi:RNA/RNP complex-1-interacting phosphatase homolog [Anopheles maculipalpis]|uniref:RNA/RNP complex-1-interacting phosphatase homolog n=1 Tax=Anopheles maculipalpis TaxID=1496333 RepID=UPI0021597093|nr:RNA/RNP complex-1-interacting phosphatase homolog [Anopheles maculipalpis]
MGSVPKGWNDYTNYGEVLVDTFIPLKVPLSRDNIFVPSHARFTPEDVMLQLNVGLIIDLTNTKRYYNPREFTSNGIDHVKVSIPGKMVPKHFLVKRFIRLVKNFRNDSRNERKLIGVHCTHGLNRTGYLICTYMIQELGYDPMEAIQLFNTKRGHEMERNNYLENLQCMLPGRREEPVYISKQYDTVQDRNRWSRQNREEDSAGMQRDRSYRSYDNSASRDHMRPAYGYDNNHHERFNMYTTSDRNQLKWDPTVRRVVSHSTHNFRVPSYRNALTKETGKHSRFE